MRYVSVCAGIEAATVAWHPLGYTPVCFAEIDPFPCAVLRHHYPDVPLVGDFTQLILTPPTAEVLVGGTPCQSFSVAGKRLSLEDYRGNLSLAFADLFHAGQYAYAVWENVPGVLSTADNAFGCLLGRLVGADAPCRSGRPGGKWTRAGVVSGPQATAAWRVLDAQYFGVAQRRRRVFVCVARGAGNGAAVRALFPVTDGLSGHPPTRGQAGEGATSAAGPGVAAGFDVRNITSRANRTRVADGLPMPTLHSEPMHVIAFTTDQEPKSQSDLAFTLTKNSPTGGGQLQSVVASTLVAPGQQWNSMQNLPNIVVSHDPAMTLTAREAKGPLREADLSTIVCTTGLVTHALSSEGADASEDGTGRGTPIIAMRPRRLTPREYERLQGFPDDYTLVPWKKGLAPDGLRYRALGNSMAVPVMRWIGSQLLKESLL